MDAHVQEAAERLGYAIRPKVHARRYVYVDEVEEKEEGRGFRDTETDIHRQRMHNAYTHGSTQIHSHVYIMHTRHVTYSECLIFWFLIYCVSRIYMLHTY